MECIHIEQRSDGISLAVDGLRAVLESKYSGQYTHFAIEGFPQWHTLCALEEAFIGANAYKDWTFVVGTVEDDYLVKGWLEYGDWIVVPHSPADANGCNIAVWSRSDWDDREYCVRAVAPAGPESGMVLNAISKSLGQRQ